jgi:hypothetical protein
MEWTQASAFIPPGGYYAIMIPIEDDKENGS